MFQSFPAKLFGHHTHRIDRVLSFLSSRQNWDSPIPSHAGKRERMGVSQFQRGTDTVVPVLLGIYVLLVIPYSI